MLNRPATKIDLCLEEELNEYEEMKQLRLKNPIMFQNQFGTLSNFKTNNNLDIIDQSPILDGGIDKDSFFNNNKQIDNFPPKEFNLSNVLFSNDSSSKIPQIQNSPGTVQQFQTPENK